MHDPIVYAATAHELCLREMNLSELPKSNPATRENKSQSRSGSESLSAEYALNHYVTVNTPLRAPPSLVTDTVGLGTEDPDISLPHDETEEPPSILLHWTA